MAKRADALVKCIAFAPVLRKLIIELKVRAEADAKLGDLRTTLESAVGAGPYPREAIPRQHFMGSAFEVVISDGLVASSKISDPLELLVRPHAAAVQPAEVASPAGQLANTVGWVSPFTGAKTEATIANEWSYADKAQASLVTYSPMQVFVKPVVPDAALLADASTERPESVRPVTEYLGDAVGYEPVPANLVALAQRMGALMLDEAQALAHLKKQVTRDPGRWSHILKLENGNLEFTEAAKLGMFISERTMSIGAVPVKVPTEALPTTITIFSDTGPVLHALSGATVTLNLRAPALTIDLPDLGAQAAQDLFPSSTS